MNFGTGYPHGRPGADVQGVKFRPGLRNPEKHLDDIHDLKVQTPMTPGTFNTNVDQKNPRPIFRSESIWARLRDKSKGTTEPKCRFSLISADFCEFSHIPGKSRFKSLGSENFIRKTTTFRRKPQKTSFGFVSLSAALQHASGEGKLGGSYVLAACQAEIVCLCHAFSVMKHHFGHRSKNENISTPFGLIWSVKWL